MFCSHSIDEAEIKLCTIGRAVAMASQMINLSMITPTKDV